MRGTLRGAPRVVRVAAAQMGPIDKHHTRADAVDRLCALLQRAADLGAQLVVFPELALTTFFPRWFVDDIASCDHYYEREMPGRETQRLFDLAKKLQVGFSLGYAELTADGRRFNTQVLVERDGRIVAKYRKVHIPGHASNEPGRPFQHAERYYFEPSDEGFGVWDAFGGRIGMMICNDRRWPETYREMGLQGVELIVCGYNTPLQYIPDPSQDRLAGFHNGLVMQAGAYQNGTFVVASPRVDVKKASTRSPSRRSSRRRVKCSPRPSATATRSSWPTATSSGARTTKTRCSTSITTAGPRPIAA